MTDVQKFDAAREQGFRIKKMRANMAFVGKTDGEGPIAVGFCSPGLAMGDVSEWFASDPQSDFDMTSDSSQTVNNHVYPVWVIPKDGTESPVTPSVQMMYNTIRYPWKEHPEGASLQIFAHAINATITTGIVLQVNGVIVMEWLDD